MRRFAGARAPKPSTLYRVRAVTLSCCTALGPFGLIILDARSVEASNRADVALAEALFREARELVAGGKLEEACPKFAESQRLDPAPGTLLNLGDCLERAGRFASAWAAYQEAATASLRAGLSTQSDNAMALAREVEAKVPRLVISVEPPSDLPDLSVTRDGVLVPRAQWNTPLPLDPGPHALTASASGRVPFSRRVDLSASPPLVTIVSIPVLGAKPVLVATVPRAPTSSVPPQKVAATVTGATGLAVVAVGAVVGVLALGRDGEAREAGCDDARCWTPRGRELTVEARQLAGASTWLFAAGTILFGTGATLWLTTAPAAPAGAAQGVAVGGRATW